MACNGIVSLQSTTNKKWFVTNVEPIVTNACVAVQVCVEPWALINVFINGTNLPAKERATFLKDPSDTVEAVLNICRAKFHDQSPSLLHNVQADLTCLDQIKLDTGIDANIATLLPPLTNVLQNQDIVKQHRLPTTTLDKLSPVRSNGNFLPASVRKVRYNQKTYVAKGPLYTSQVKHFVAELKMLLRPEILNQEHFIAKPYALLILSQEDPRICGFLLPYYPNGNLDTYAQTRHQTKSLTLSDMLRWYSQITQALLFLEQNGTWHGDLKPDNILVTEDLNVLLTDFTRVVATSVTASPEVRKHCQNRVFGGHMASPDDHNDNSNHDHNHTDNDNDDINNTILLGVPTTWSVTKVMQSEIYSLGRTMYLVLTNQPMIDIYQHYGWVSDHPFETFNGNQDIEALDHTTIERTSKSKTVTTTTMTTTTTTTKTITTAVTTVETTATEAINELRQLVIHCTKHEPDQRPTLTSLFEHLIPKIHTRYDCEQIIVQAVKSKTQE